MSQELTSRASRAVRSTGQNERWGEDKSHLRPVAAVLHRAAPLLRDGHRAGHTRDTVERSHSSPRRVPTVRVQGPSHKKTKRIEKMYQYADTVEFDLMVVFLVVCVMPLAVFLMQSKTKVGRAMSLALMVLAILYVGGFEHYRMHRPEVTEGGLKAAVFPAAFLDLIESETFTLTYLPIGADPDTIAKASAGIDRRNATTAARVAASARAARRREAVRAKKRRPRGRAAHGAPVAQGRG